VAELTETKSHNGKITKITIGTKIKTTIKMLKKDGSQNRNSTR
jgi:hypothetical protein